MDQLHLLSARLFLEGLPAQKDVEDVVRAFLLITFHQKTGQLPSLLKEVLNLTEKGSRSILIDNQTTKTISAEISIKVTADVKFIKNVPSLVTSS